MKPTPTPKGSFDRPTSSKNWAVSPFHLRDTLGMRRDENDELIIEVSEAVRSALYPPVPKPQKPIWYGLGARHYEGRR